MTIDTIQYLTTIRFGNGASTLLGTELKELSFKRPLVVSDKALVELGLVAEIVSRVGDGIPIFDGTPSNPTEEAVNTAAAVFVEQNCDCLIAIGG